MNCAKCPPCLEGKKYGNGKQICIWKTCPTQERVKIELKRLQEKRLNSLKTQETTLTGPCSNSEVVEVPFTVNEAVQSNLSEKISEKSSAAKATELKRLEKQKDSNSLKTQESSTTGSSEVIEVPFALNEEVQSNLPEIITEKSSDAIATELKMLENKKDSNSLKNHESASTESSEVIEVPFAPNIGVQSNSPEKTTEKSSDSKVTEFKCSKCYMSFPSEQFLSLHKCRAEEKKPKFECSFCNEKFFFKFEVSKHCLLIHNKDLKSKKMNDEIDKKLSFELEFPSENDTNSESEGDDFTEQNRDKATFECPVCNKKYLSQFKVKKHFLLIHNDEEFNKLIKIDVKNKKKVNVQEKTTSKNDNSDLTSDGFTESQTDISTESNKVVSDTIEYLLEVLFERINLIGEKDGPLNTAQTREEIKDSNEIEIFQTPKSKEQNLVEGIILGADKINEEVVEKSTPISMKKNIVTLSPYEVALQSNSLIVKHRNLINQDNTVAKCGKCERCIRINCNQCFPCLDEIKSGVRKQTCLLKTCPIQEALKAELKSLKSTSKLDSLSNITQTQGQIRDSNEIKILQNTKKKGQNLVEDTIVTAAEILTSLKRHKESNLSKTKQKKLNENISFSEVEEVSALPDLISQSGIGKSNK